MSSSIPAYSPMVSGWANNATLGIAGPIIVDGAKRDRWVLSNTPSDSRGD